MFLLYLNLKIYGIGRLISINTFPIHEKENLVNFPIENCLLAKFI